MIGLNRVKTWILIAALGGLFVLIGGAIGGQQGAILALGIALLFNFSMYWFIDKIAIATTRSKPVTEQEAPDLYRIVRELTQINQMPMPRIYVSDMMQPNAFATGRNPQHAVVAVTRGILEILDERELRGVLAHELSHVANRDILIGSIAAAIGMSITFLARFALWFGSGDDRNGIGIVAVARLGPGTDRGRDHPDGREPLARVPGRRIGCDPVARPRRAGERAPQDRERRRQGPGARVGEPRRGPPVHREPVPRPPGVHEPGEPVLDASPDGRARREARADQARDRLVRR